MTVSNWRTGYLHHLDCNSDCWLKNQTPTSPVPSPNSSPQNWETELSGIGGKVPNLFKKLKLCLPPLIVRASIQFWGREVNIKIFILQIEKSLSGDILKG